MMKAILAVFPVLCLGIFVGCARRAEPPPLPGPVMPAPPASSGAPVATSRAEAEKRFAAGQQLAKQGKWREAIEEYTQAINLNPNFAKAYAARGVAHHTLSQWEVEKTRVLLAKQDLDKAIELDPNLVSAYVDRGYVEMEFAYQAAGRPAEAKQWMTQALADFDQAIEIDAKYAGAYKGRGDWYYHQQQYEEALKELNQAIRLNPKAPYAYVSRANVYGALGEKQKADADLKKADQLAKELGIVMGD